MLKNYNKKLVLDYIYGNDIVGYDIDELEEDYEFMIEVIKQTRDKRMYSLCSDNVRKNYDFVSFMMDTFKDDKDFVLDVVDGYFGNIMNVDSNNLEDRDITLVIMVSDLFDRSYYDNPKIMKYNMIASSFYLKSIAVIRGDMSNENIGQEKEFGLGFGILMSMYAGNYVILDFFAKRMINDIFCFDNGIDGKGLECFLHERYDNFEDISSQGINNFIINYVMILDSYLAMYISTRIGIVTDLNKDILRIGKRWDDYTRLIKKNKAIIFEDELDSFVKNYSNGDYEMAFDFLGMKAYLIRLLHLEDFFTDGDYDVYEGDMIGFNGWDNGFDDLERAALEDRRYQEKNCNRNMDFMWERCIIHMREVASKLFERRTTDLNSEYRKRERDRVRAKVLRFDSIKYGKNEDNI